MSARSTGDDHLHVRLFAHFARVALVLLAAAKLAADRGRVPAGGLVVHRKALREAGGSTCRVNVAARRNEHTDVPARRCAHAASRICGYSGSSRAPDRRSSPPRRIFCALCERFKRSVEKYDGSSRYVLERARTLYRLSGRSSRRHYRGVERTPARHRYARAARDVQLQLHAARRISVSIERGRRTARLARRIFRRRSAARRRRGAGLDQSHARRPRFEGDAERARSVRHRFRFRTRARENARAGPRQRCVRYERDRRPRYLALGPAVAAGLCARAVGRQLRVLEFAAAGAAAGDDRGDPQRLRGRARRRYGATRRLRSHASRQRHARDDRFRDGLAAARRDARGPADRSARCSGCVLGFDSGTGGRAGRRLCGARASRRRRRWGDGPRGCQRRRPVAGSFAAMQSVRRARRRSAAGEVVARRRDRAREGRAFAARVRRIRSERDSLGDHYVGRSNDPYRR